MSSVTEGRPTNSVTYLVRSLSHALLAAMDERLGPEGLTLMQFVALLSLKWSPGRSNADLARSRFVTPQTMNEVIASLAKRKLVTRRRHPDGGRVLQVRLTPAGAAMLERCGAAVAAVERQMLEGMPPGDQRKLRELLRGCLARIGGAEGQKSRAS